MSETEVGGIWRSSWLWRCGPWKWARMGRRQTVYLQARMSTGLFKFFIYFFCVLSWIAKLWWLSLVGGKVEAPRTLTVVVPAMSWETERVWDVGYRREGMLFLYSQDGRQRLWLMPLPPPTPSHKLQHPLSQVITAGIVVCVVVVLGASFLGSYQIKTS